MPEKHPSYCSPLDQKNFIQYLHEVSELFAGSHLESALVGGIPLKVYLQQRVWAKRENGTDVDVDALAFGPDRATYLAVMKQIEMLKFGRADFPEIGLEAISFSPLPPRGKPFQFLSGMWRDPATDEYYLTYGKIRVQIPKETMETVEILVEGVPFQSFKRKTILERYKTRGGILKPKDLEKVAQLERAIALDPKGELPDSAYEAYHEFVFEIQEKYGAWLQAFRLFWLLDQKTNGRISGAKGLVYGMIKHFAGE